MIKKAEAEAAVRGLIHDWASETSVGDHPSFSAFVTWLRAAGYGRYLDFRSTMGPAEDAELWFDQELRQMWRR